MGGGGGASLVVLLRIEPKLINYLLPSVEITHRHYRTVGCGMLFEERPLQHDNLVSSMSISHPFDSDGDDVPHPLLSLLLKRQDLLLYRPHTVYAGPNLNDEIFY